MAGVVDGAGAAVFDSPSSFFSGELGRPKILPDPKGFADGAGVVVAFASPSVFFSGELGRPKALPDSKGFANGVVGLVGD